MGEKSSIPKHIQELLSNGYKPINYLVGEVKISGLVKGIKNAWEQDKFETSIRYPLISHLLEHLDYSLHKKSDRGERGL